MPSGLIQHAPTGLQLLALPDGAARPEGWADALPVARASLPPGTPDRRPAGCVAPGDANAPGVVAWVLLARLADLQALGLDNRARLALCRDAAARWAFRARLERGWTTGQRAA